MNPGPNELGWTDKGATLTEKTAEKEYGITYPEIVAAIKAGKLQYREISMYGNPALRLLRHEVEALISEKHGADYLKKMQLEKELVEVNKILGSLKCQARALEKRKAELLTLLETK